MFNSTRHLVMPGCVSLTANRDATPLRLDDRTDRLPSVAAKARQPWALSRNRVAVGPSNDPKYLLIVFEI